MPGFTGLPISTDEGKQHKTLQLRGKEKESAEKVMWLTGLKEKDILDWNRWPLTPPWTPSEGCWQQQKTGRC